ncbi:hypothetical protein [Methylobacterium nonmethylotrophicum]|uniref:Helix-turn-helix domain-containing protein n=1 Tax=Methylobacterium nonmethylotrophicum TaxID=1141884 RepID=A0A4Z0NDT3_9HYPH|nr:hypothetical protein [Methylobacterium nonmethylotrophicum]TGD93729.1 hypothetical protein EU555_33120 [Methylobacterium nonmethylotrophicum]
MPSYEEVLKRIAAKRSVKAATLARWVDLSPAAFYKAIERGEIEAVKIGRTRLIPAHESCRLLGIKQEDLAA